MAYDWSTAQSLQNAYLNLVGCQSNQLVKPTGKTLNALPWQADDQVCVYMRVGLISEPAKIVPRFPIILFSADPLSHFRIERLNTNFQLQRTLGKSAEPGFQLLRQTIRYHFEM